MTERNRSRPLGYRQERHRKIAMEKLAQARYDLALIKSEARLMATKAMTREAVMERAAELIIRAQAAEIAIVEAQNELLKMKAADGEDRQ